MTPRRPLRAVGAALAAVALVATAIVWLSTGHDEGVKVSTELVDDVVPSSTTEPVPSLAENPPGSTTSTAPVTTVTSADRGLTKTCVQADQHPPRGEIIGITTADGVYEVTLDGRDRFRVAGPATAFAGASWSRDGRHVAFDVGLWSDQPRPTIGITDISAHCWIEWPRGEDARRQPSLSNDGTRVAYVRGPNGSTLTADERAELADADGGNARVLGNRLASAAWAPDDSGRFAYSDSGGLKVLDRRGRTIVLHAVADSGFASWSPDATRLVYTVSTQAGVYVANADGSGHHKLVEGTGELFFMSWSPDGDQIAYELRGRLWVVNADGSNARELAGPSAVRHTPLWTTDGRSIVYTTGDYAAPTATKVMVVGAEGGTPRMIADNAALVTVFHRA